MLKIYEDKKMIKFLSLGGSIAIALIICLLFFFMQATNAGQKLNDSDSFGIGKNRFSVDARVGVIENDDYSNSKIFDAANSSLATYSTRDISTAISAISYKIALAAKAAAEAARAQELVEINIAKNRHNEHARTYGMPEGLSEVNWDIGKDAFINEWTSRIDNYLIGSPLANRGVVFATAAWNNKIDPRWSVAISNTESSKGAICFVGNNAWGWGDSGWANWDEAINAHVFGLSENYGYTITKPFAEKYCPPNSENWYNNTLSEMLKI